jgi:two-component system, cell cycle response regulator
MSMAAPDRIWKSTNLPTLPSVALQLLELSSNPESEIADFIRVIRSDPAISAKLIKAANSPYFGLSAQVSSIEGAIPLLGSTVVTSLALSFSLIGEKETNKDQRKYYQAFWSKSLLQAVTAETLARKYRTTNPAEAFLSGLLCDLGVLTQLRGIPDEYLHVLNLAEENLVDLFAVEREQLGFDHIEIGAKMMLDWRMPEQLIEAVRLHHAAESEIQVISNGRRKALVQIVRFASAVGEYLTRDGDKTIHNELCELAQSIWKLAENEVNGLLDEVRSRTDEAAALMAIDTNQLPRPADLLARANEQLAEIAMREHAVITQVSLQSAVLEMENRRLRERNTALHEQAGVDSLTGLHNRGAFDEVFETMVGSCVRRGSTVGVIFADVDNFKKLNDTCGHQFGDEVLRRVARILKSTVRGSDFVARYGGEEFVIIAADCPAHVVNAISERIRGRVESEEFQCNGRAVSVTISVGGCVAPSSAVTEDVDQALAKAMLQQADDAMYHCKRNGRNQILVKHVDHDASTTRTLAT